MITDVHTHFWIPDHQQPPWTDGLGRVSTRLAAGAIDSVTVESYRRQVFPAARTIVFGLQAQASGIMVPNDGVCGPGGRGPWPQARGGRRPGGGGGAGLRVHGRGPRPATTPSPRSSAATP